MIVNKQLKRLLGMAGAISLLAACQATPLKTHDEVEYSPPVRVALEAMGSTFQNEVTRLSITQQVSGGEVANKAIVTIEEHGLKDDSVAALRTVFTLARTHNKWAIISQNKTQKCYPQRGHQDFSAQPCH